MKVDVLLVHPPVNFFLKRNPIQHSSCVGYGLLHIAACLIQRGYKVAVWNLEAIRPSQYILPQSLQISLEKFDPSVIGIELNWVSFSKGAIQTAELFKKIRPDIPIILGGTHATIFSTEIVRNYHQIVDAVLRGEGEKTFIKVVENVEKDRGFHNIGGLVTFKDGYIYEVPISKSDLYMNIDDIPPYSNKIILPINLDTTRLGLGPSINTCRGPCNYNCIYCIGGQKPHFSSRESFSVHSPKWIINQINILIEEGAKEIAFQDLLFLSGKKRLIQLAKMVRNEKINEEIAGFNMTAIPGFLDGETLEELSRAGIYNIDYGTETGSNHIMRILNRPTSKKKILDSIKVTASKGIIPFTWWMIGLPKERPEDIEETLKLINKTTELGSIPRWITPLIILPSTLLFKQARKFDIKIRMKSFEDFSIYSDLGEKAISWYPETISHETEFLNQYDILRETIKLKIDVFQKRDIIIDNFIKNIDTIISYHPLLSSNILENMIKDTLGYLLKTFY
ncbi:MAG: radical SAM protein [Candidatus Helarchaeota archaeon]|nr:radical SAM protein [Candidatus Helarchaeota archaeon]